MFSQKKNQKRILFARPEGNHLHRNATRRCAVHCNQIASQYQPTLGGFSSVGVTTQQPHATLVEYSGSNTGTKPRSEAQTSRIAAALKPLSQVLRTCRAQRQPLQITSSMRRATLATTILDLSEGRIMHDTLLAPEPHAGRLPIGWTTQ